MPSRPLWQQILGLVAAFVLCFGVAGAGGFATAQGLESWYPALRKPSFQPPAWVFGPVWTFLYADMAIAAWLVWRKAGWTIGGRALGWFAIQLTLNLAWSLIFFGMRRPGLAMVDIVALWVAIVFTIREFWRIQPLPGGMMIPYLLWVSFASALNFAIWRLNP